MPSPYVSLREAVRPAIFAYGILAAEREQAGALAAECDELLAVTRELLRKLALARLLTPEQELLVPAQGVADDRQATLLDAYADAGMLWARVVGICTAIADALLEQGEWAKVSHLADVLADAGEAAAGKELSRRAKDGPAELTRRQIRNVHGVMSMAEIRDALNVLRELPKAFPNREFEIATALPSICISMLRLVPGGDEIGLLFQCDYVRENGCEPNMAEYFLSHAVAEFAQLQQMITGG